MGAMTEKILNLTLEIIYLLTGEDYIMVKKTDQDSRGRPPDSPTTDPLLFSLPHNRNNKKILKMTNKIIELLSGEVPSRCQDVAVFFSLEEWEYIEEHKDLYQDAMMDSQQAIGSEGGSSEGNPAESCGCVPCSQDCTAEEDRTGTQDYQVESEDRTLLQKEGEPELDLISAVLSISCDENPSNPSPASPPPDCTATCPKFECYSADRSPSPNSSAVSTRLLTVQDEERPSGRQPKV
ncbi:unnamed protein product [Staurois parvus]|uniref:KRAB domain-containing protein n=1 Tax=Staurois parvus TaxID=386267 RepID=A0ABN9CTQ9_9NEOB|nr:unnamed protein product [Staurois parvus]